MSTIYFLTAKQKYNLREKVIKLRSYCLPKFLSQKQRYELFHLLQTKMASLLFEMTSLENKRKLPQTKIGT